MLGHRGVDAARPASQTIPRAAPALWSTSCSKCKHHKHPLLVRSTRLSERFLLLALLRHRVAVQADDAVAPAQTLNDQTAGIGLIH